MKPLLLIVMLTGSALCQNIKVKDVPADVPTFKREYKMALGKKKITMTITCSSRYYSWRGLERSCDGELTQPDGKWVLFEPNRPADKILDSTLLPLVISGVAEIRKLDRAYMNPRPDYFVDESGTHWRAR